MGAAFRVATIALVGCGRLGFPVHGSDGGDSTTIDFPPATIRLSNVGATASCSTFVRPAVNEYGHFLAVRLTPPSTPFTVGKIEYALENQPAQNCLAGLVHVVQAFKSTTTTPPATPNALDELSIDLSDTLPVGVVLVEQTLAAPVLLDAGEHFFIAIQMVGDASNNKLCVETCDMLDPMATGELNFWSDATSPPYPWRLSTITVANVTSLGWQ